MKVLRTACAVFALGILGLVRLAAASAISNQVVDASTADKKFLLGYQGGYACPGDGSGLTWSQWFRSQSPTAKELKADLLPDVSELEPEELHETGLAFENGKPVRLYSAYDCETVKRHFKWMREYGLDGVMLRRFTRDLGEPLRKDFCDRVLANARAGAEANGRVFAVMYDISGDKTDIVQALKKDWMALVDSKKITKCPRYLRHLGKPLVCVWGLGFNDRPGSVEQAREIIDWFKNNPQPRFRTCLMGIVPMFWRYCLEDSKTDREWLAVYKSFDILSPWTVGRYDSPLGADNYWVKYASKDFMDVEYGKIGYLPVVFPGFSKANLDPPGKDVPRLNRIRRRGGAFLWRQVYNMMSGGATMLLGATFDQLDEGTALFKLAASKDQLPLAPKMVSLDADGYKLPSDWYLRVAGMATRMLHGEIPLTRRMPLDPGNPAASNKYFPDAPLVK
jgi:hypothetical protein